MPPAASPAATSLLTALSAPRWETGTWRGRNSNSVRAGSPVRVDNLTQYKPSFPPVSCEGTSGEERLGLTTDLWGEAQRKRRFLLSAVSLQTTSAASGYRLPGSLAGALPTLLRAEFCADHQLLCSRGRSSAFQQSLLLLPVKGTAHH